MWTEIYIHEVVKYNAFFVKICFGDTNIIVPSPYIKGHKCPEKLWMKRDAVIDYNLNQYVVG